MKHEEQSFILEEPFLSGLSALKRKEIETHAPSTFCMGGSVSVGFPLLRGRKLKRAKAAASSHFLRLCGLSALKRKEIETPGDRLAVPPRASQTVGFPLRSYEEKVPMAEEQFVTYDKYRADLADFRTDMATFREEVRSDIAQIRDETKNSIFQIRQKTSEALMQIRLEMTSLRQETNEALMQIRLEMGSFRAEFHKDMIVQTRWTIGLISLIVGALVAIGKFL